MPMAFVQSLAKGLAGQLAYDRSARVSSGPLKRQALINQIVAADHIHGRVNCPNKPCERVIHAPDGRTLGHPELWSKPTKLIQFLSHWSDTKNEPDGTPPELLATADQSESVPEERFGHFSPVDCQICTNATRTKDMVSPCAWCKEKQPLCKYCCAAITKPHQKGVLLYKCVACRRTSRIRGRAHRRIWNSPCCLRTILCSIS